MKSGGDLTISNSVAQVNDDSHNHVISNVNGLQTALDGKAATGHTHDDRYYTESEINTKLNGKANTSHSHSYLPLSGGVMTGSINLNIGGRSGSCIGFYAGDSNGSGIAIGAGGRTIIGSGESAQNLRTALGTATANEAAEEMHISGDANVLIHTNCQTIANRKTFTFSSDGSLTAGTFKGSLSGNASTATALTTSAGSTTQPIYFSGGKPVACSYTLGKSVPSNAVFTDTKYTPPTTSGNKHIPSGGSSGQILRWSADGTAVWGADNNTIYSNMTAATASAAGKAGLVPAPAAGAQAKYLTGSGTWQNVDDHAADFTSADVAGGSAAARTNVAKLTSGETHKSIFEKISTMFKNVRYLYKVLGSANISGIGNGTVTGAITALNSNLRNTTLYVKPMNDTKSLNITCSRMDYDSASYIVYIYRGSMIVCVLVIDGCGNMGSTTLKDLGINHGWIKLYENTTYTIDGVRGAIENNTIRTKILLKTVSNEYRAVIKPLSATALSGAAIYSAKWTNT